MIVEKGDFDAVSLDDTTWASTYHWSGPLHVGNGTGQPILDARMGDEQRQALAAILCG